MIITNLKHSIWNLIFSLLFVSITTIMLTVMIEYNDLLWIIISLIIFVFSIVMLFIYIREIQWFKIEDDRVVVKNIFGIIKTIEYVNIKKSFKIKAKIFSIKACGTYKPYIVLSFNKSLQKSKVEDAYNRKKNKYVIIPYTSKNEYIINTKYKECVGKDLEL